MAFVAVAVATGSTASRAQEYGKADHDQPGDLAVQSWLAKNATQLADGFLDGIDSADDWLARRARYREEYFHMLGLWPLPEKTPLKATVTGTVLGEDFVVEKLHYQSRPGLYVTANLYRPVKVPAGERLPAVLYVCGHSHRGRDGNKTAYQSHGLWFARHGYVCLFVDTLQLGEIGATHHGTYREQRWWWHSRGYTPAGVECWNGVRGIDYLTSRADVDPERTAVTGISGGGAATFWVAAADDRVKVAVPVSGMADLPSYVTNRVINGHCDCMFLYNTFQWPWTRIAAIMAPRPLLFVNSDADRIFPMDANERIISRLERLYSLFGASDRVDAVVSVGGHAYRKDIRQSSFRFINTWLKNDPRVVEDSEVDLVRRVGRHNVHPIPPESLRVFPTDADIPADELNTTIDRHFAPLAKVEVPPPHRFLTWRGKLLDELRRVSFRALPKKVEAARQVKRDGDRHSFWETADGARFSIERTAIQPQSDRFLVVVIARDEEEATIPSWEKAARTTDRRLWIIRTRGTHTTRWTRKNPPNYVERSFALLGRTADGERVTDTLAAIAALREGMQAKSVEVAGTGPGGIIAACAAVFDPQVTRVELVDPPASFHDADSPQFLNVLRVCDVPELLGLLAPRPLAARGIQAETATRVEAIWTAAGAEEALALVVESTPEDE